MTVHNKKDLLFISFLFSERILVFVSLSPPALACSFRLLLSAVRATISHRSRSNSAAWPPARFSMSASRYCSMQALRSSAWACNECLDLGVGSNQPLAIAVPFRPSLVSLCLGLLEQIHCVLLEAPLAQEQFPELFAVVSCRPPRGPHEAWHGRGGAAAVAAGLAAVVNSPAAAAEREGGAAAAAVSAANGAGAAVVAAAAGPGFRTGRAGFLQRKKEGRRICWGGAAWRSMEVLKLFQLIFSSPLADLPTLSLAFFSCCSLKLHLSGSMAGSLSRKAWCSDPFEKTALSALAALYMIIL